MCEEHTDAQAEVGKLMRRSNRPAPVIGSESAVCSSGTLLSSYLSISRGRSTTPAQSAAPRTNYSEMMDQTDT